MSRIYGFRRTLVGLKHADTRRRARRVYGFRRTLVGLKLRPIRLDVGLEPGFRRTLVGLKQANGDQERGKLRFRRTLVGLKQVGAATVLAPSFVFQTYPRGVEATTHSLRLRLSRTFQTYPRGVEAFSVGTDRTENHCFRRTLVGLKQSHPWCN
jgi:hypothetical protein